MRLRHRRELQESGEASPYPAPVEVAHLVLREPHSVLGHDVGPEVEAVVVGHRSVHKLPAERQPQQRCHQGQGGDAVPLAVGGERQARATVLC